METFILGMALGAVVVHVFNAVKMYFAMLKLREILGKDLFEQITESEVKSESESKSPIIQSRVEEINGVFYIYNTENNEFIAQGKTQNEIIEHLQSRQMFNCNLSIVDGDDKAKENLRKLIAAGNT